MAQTGLTLITPIMKSPSLSITGPLPQAFFSRPTTTVARELLGCLLVRQLDGVRLSGIIVEAEAYIGEEDLACHARVGRTPRTRVMYGPAGFSYEIGRAHV